MGPIVGWKDDGSELFVDHGSATMWNMEFMMKAERDSFKPGFLVVNLWAVISVQLGCCACGVFLFG